MKNYIKRQSPADFRILSAEIASLVPESTCITTTPEKLLLNLKSQPLQTLIELEAPIEIITDVISKKNINKKNDDGLTPLHFAIRRRKWEIIPTFYHRGGDINATVSNYNNDLYTPLFDSITYFSPDQITRMLISPQIINMQCEDEWTALHLAIHRARWTIASDLLEAGADVNLVCRSGETALSAACKRNFERIIPMDIFTQLISPHNINLPNKDGDTPLHIAALHSGSTFIPTLLEHGADINVRGLHNRTPLHYAIGSYWRIDDDIISQLISPTSINVIGRYMLGRTKISTLELAIYRKLYSTALLLLKRGADPSTVMEFREELSLKELCIISIRRAMRVISDDTLATLPLPRQIIKELDMGGIAEHFEHYLQMAILPYSYDEPSEFW